MKKFWKNLKFAWKYAKKQKKKLLIFLFLNLLSIIIGVLLPILSAKQIVALTDNMLEQLAFITVVILVVEWIRNVMNYLARTFNIIIYRETFKEIQIHLGEEILKIENQCLDENSSGVFIQRLTGDTSNLAGIFNNLNNHLTKIIMNIGIFCAVLVINRIAFIYMILMLFLIFLLEYKRIKLRDINDKEVRKKNEVVVGFVGELVRGARDIKMLDAERSFMKELKEKIIETNDARYHFSKTDKQYQFWRGMLIDFFDASMVFLLIYLIANQNLEIAMAIVIYNYIGRVVSIIDYSTLLAEEIENFNLSAERIFQIIYGEEFSKEKFGEKHLNKVKGCFEFQNVSFRI